MACSARAQAVRRAVQVQPVLTDTALPREKFPYSLPCGLLGQTSKQAQGCAGEGLNPEGISPRLRARMLAVTCKMSLFESTI